MIQFMKNSTRHRFTLVLSSLIVSLVFLSVSKAETTSDDGLSARAPVTDASAPLALIYKGPGSCSLDQGDAGTSGYGCSEASADAATLAGFRFQYVAPRDSPDFSSAKVWIQPGGISDVAYDAMTPKLRSNLIKFVADGGGYVGFCAGAFLAADWFYIFPGSAHAYRYPVARPDVGYNYLDLNWNGKARKVYFEGGPYLTDLGPKAEVTGKFSTGYVAAARAPYGKGRVYITGAHPEAPAIWSQEDGITDPDGSDLDLAAEMITWASGN
jgi:hypothetical protein